jgi:hypothetical protein
MPLTTVSQGLLSTDAQYTGFKNRLINGDMQIDQRNNGAAVTNSTGNIFTLDRWLSTTVGSNCTVQQVTGSTGNNRAARVTGASGNGTTILSQKIEAANIFDCASQTVTVSFTVYGSVAGTMYVRFLYPTATNNFTSTTEPVGFTAVPFTTTATRYSVTRTLDANANKGLLLVFEYGPTGAGVTWTLEDTQLEKGNVATSFDVLPIGTELQLCQRYYYKATTGTLFNQLAFCNIRTTTSHYAFLQLPVTLRANPSSVDYGGIGVIAAWGAGVTGLNSLTLADAAYGAGTTQVLLNAVTSGAVGTVGQISFLLGNNSTTGFVALNAEL